MGKHCRSAQLLGGLRGTGRLRTALTILAISVTASACGRPNLLNASKLNRTIKVLTADFLYTPDPVVGTVGTPITTAAPTIAIQPGMVWSVISPALPAGISIDPSTGVISGTPTAITPEQTYSIALDFDDSQKTGVFTLTINDISPANLSYTPDPVVLTRTITMVPPMAPNATGGATVSYSVDPALPSGITLNTSTGEISGTPTAISATTSYTITATNSGGSTSFALTMTVNDLPPVFSYTTSPMITKRLAASTPNDPISTGGAIVTFSIDPSLPSGLSISPTTGRIQGTPTMAAPLGTATYTVTGTNSGGSSTANVDITINQADLPALTYTELTSIYIKGVLIDPENSPTGFSGGTITSYAVSPALPAGINIDPSTGVIYGVPTAVTANANYTVTATGPAGSADVVIAIRVNDLPPAFSYTFPDPTYTKNSTIADNNPINTGGAPTSYIISPALTAGLSFNTTTGRLYGTPTAVASLRNYTVTATNSGGSSTAPLDVIVVDIPPTGLSYSDPTATYIKGSAITNNLPSLGGGGAVTSYSISPQLPAGLNINATTGVIFGAPSVVALALDYTVTAINSGGQTTAIVNITVNDAPPGSISYSENPAVYYRSVAITPNLPSDGAGGGITFSVNPALPMGLSLNTTDGTISGTPTGGISSANYTVTRTGTPPVDVNITVLEEPPANLAYSQNTVTYPHGIAIINNIPSSTGGAITSYSISPPLPIGLDFNETTGVISGTPLTTSLAVNYTVTGANSGGSTQKVISIAISGLAPVVASIFPKGGINTGGTPVTITGNYFFPGATVSIGSSPCTSVNVVSGTQLTCTTTGHASGLANVVVANPDLQSSTLTAAFMYSGKVWLGGAAQSMNAWASGGSPATGSGDGMLQSTYSNFPGPDGYIYIVDSGGHRIAKYDMTTGAFIGWIGRVSLSPTGGVDGCTSVAAGDVTPGWCTGGSPQTGNMVGAFNFTRGGDVYVSSSGNLYVADPDNNRVQKFDAATGAFIGWIGNGASGWTSTGTASSGTGDGQFTGARAVTADVGETTLYVADRDNNRVQKFNLSTGVFQGWIGLKSGTVTASWTTGGTASGGTGTNDGRMSSPRGLARDNTHLYVMDTANSRINRYNLSSGAFAGALGRVANTGKTGMSCISGAGTINNNAATPCWAAGGSTQTTATPGGDGMLSGNTNPRGVWADATGNNLFAADYDGHRVMRFNLSTGAFTGWIGRVNSVSGISCTSGTPAPNAFTPDWCTGGTSQSGTGTGHLNSAAVVTMDPSRVYLYVSDFTNARINRYYLSNGQPAGSLGAIKNVAPAWIANGVPQSGNGDAVFSGTQRAVSDGTYLYVSDSGNHRIQRFDAANGAFLGWIGRISDASGMSCENGSPSAGNFTPSWCIGGTSQSGTTAGNGNLNSPSSIAVSGGILYVAADPTNGHMRRYNAGTGAYINTITLANARSLTVNAAGTYLYVSYNGTNNNRVRRINLSNDSGTDLITGLTAAYDVAIHPTTGDILVVERTANRVSRYSSAGASLGNAATGLNAPQGVAFDPTGTYFYVSDSGTHRILKYMNSDNSFVGWQGNIATSPTGGDSGCIGALPGTDTPGWCTGGTAAAGNGNGMLNAPSGISTYSNGSDYSLFIGDTGNNRVVRLDEE